MKLCAINDIDEFLDIIDDCSGEIVLSSEHGDRIDLKGRLGGYLSLASLISNGYIKELDITVNNDDDMKLLAPYLVK